MDQITINGFYLIPTPPKGVGHIKKKKLNGLKKNNR